MNCKQHPDCGCDAARAALCLPNQPKPTGLRLVTMSVKEAEAFLAGHERHYKAPAEPICAIGVADDQGIHGAAILGRRDASTGELAHIYVDGVSQGYTLLYGACWRALKALGYEKSVL